MSNTNNASLSAEQIKNKILSSKGSFVKARWKSNPKPAATFKAYNLEKITEGVVRAGINFANLSSVKDAIANGDRGEVQSLPWGEWKLDSEGKSMFPYIITHKDADYIRLYPSDGVNHYPKSTFYVNGEIVDKETFATYLTNSESKKLLDPSGESRPECFTIKSDNILGIPEDIEE